MLKKVVKNNVEKNNVEKNDRKKKKCAYIKFLHQRCVGKTHLCNTYYNLLVECRENKFIFSN